jgi:hypothetical protein
MLNLNIKVMQKNYLIRLVALSFYLAYMVIWHDIIFAVNNVSKMLQSLAMCIYSTFKHIQGIIEYFEKYRDDVFSTSLHS